MSSKTVLTRQLHLCELVQLMTGLVAAIKQSTASAEKVTLAVQTALSAACVQCGIRLNGQELLTLGCQTPATATEIKISRLLQSYCARNGCESRYYTVVFGDHIDLDWPKLLSGAESTAKEGDEAEQTTNWAAANAHRLDQRKRLAMRAAIGVGMLLLMLLIRQWYLGGRIPVIREPENFKVDRGQAVQPAP
jgi:hypothetical protein